MRNGTALAAVAAAALLAGCGGNPAPADRPASSAAPLLSCAMTAASGLGYAVAAAPRGVDDGFVAEKYLPPGDTDGRTRAVLRAWAEEVKGGYRLGVTAERYQEQPGATRTTGRPRSTPGGPIPLPPGGPISGPRIPGDPRGPVTAGSWRRIASGRVGRDATLVRSSCADGIPDQVQPRDTAAPAPAGAESGAR
jgi:hypothetical protein